MTGPHATCRLSEYCLRSSPGDLQSINRLGRGREERRGRRGEEREEKGRRYEREREGSNTFLLLFSKKGIAMNSGSIGVAI